jgi:hypothetical protein
MITLTVITLTMITLTGFIFDQDYFDHDYFDHGYFCQDSDMVLIAPRLLLPDAASRAAATAAAACLQCRSRVWFCSN